VNKSEQWTISTKKQLTSSSWITCGEGKDGVEQSVRSGVSAKCTVRSVGEAVEVGGVLWAKRSRSRVKRSSGVEGEAIEVDGVLRTKWSRSRAKRSSGVEGEAVNVTTCSRGEAVEGVLRALSASRHAP
jgi:hypothetical protein